MSSTSTSSLINTLGVIQRQFFFGFALVILIFGVTGCFVNILLFSRRQFRTVSCCIYFLGASVVMLIQVSLTGATFLYSSYYTNPLFTLESYCKIFTYELLSTSMMFRWMLAAACVDRYALSSTHARLRQYRTEKNARMVVIIIVLTWIVLAIPALVLNGLRNGSCGIIFGYGASLYNNIFTMINGYGIPITIMTICSLLIRQNLAQKRVRRHFEGQQAQRTNNKQVRQRKRDQQALVMLFAQIFVYIILTTPWMIYGIYDTISLGIPNKSADRLAIERFLLSLTGTIIILFPVSSFYLYTLTSSMYRKELFIILSSVLSCQYFNNNRRVQPIRSTAAQRTIPMQ